MRAVGFDRTVRVYQTQLLAQPDSFRYHNIINHCHASAYFSSYRGFVLLKESQALRLGGGFCQLCGQRMKRRQKSVSQGVPK